MASFLICLPFGIFFSRGVSVRVATYPVLVFWINSWLVGDFIILTARSHVVSVSEKLPENDGTHNPPVSNLASTPSFQVMVRLGRFEVPPMKSTYPDSQPVDDRGANVSWAFAFERRPLIRIVSRALVSLQVWCSGIDFEQIYLHHRVLLHKWKRGLGAPGLPTLQGRGRRPL